MERSFPSAIVERVPFSGSSVEERINLAKKINQLSKNGRWDESYNLACSEKDISRKANFLLEASLKDFNRKGDILINERYMQENRELCNTDFDLAVDVEQGEISREAALIISKLYGGKVDSEQIYEIASAFVARKEGENINDFDRRRIAEINSLNNVEGMSDLQVKNMKDEILSALYIYNKLETSSANKISSWPIRSDGQIRRSFVNRSKLLDLSIKVLHEVQDANGNIDSRIRKIQEESKVPEKIESLENILNISELGEKIKCVSFDMFDTLVEWVSNTDERHKLMMNSALTILRKHNININPKAYTEIREEIWYKKYKNKLYPLREFKAEDAIAEMVDRICKEKKCNINAEEKEKIVAEINSGFIEVDSDTAIPTPGIMNTLRGLKEKGVKAIVISNHPYNRKSIKFLLDKYGLSEYIDDIVISSEVGFRKTRKDPEAMIFKHALEKNHLNPDQIIHVGDNSDNDFDAPRAVNIKGIRFDNPEATQKIIEHGKFHTESPEYKNACMENLKKYLDHLSFEYYARIKKENTPQELEKYALRVYNISRDYYAPLLIKFSEHCLDKLKGSNDSINLCVGRDALAVFLIQNKMAGLFPEKYGNELKDRIKYVPFSRNTVLNSDQNRLKKFMSKLGIDDKKNINIVDNGIVGTIQNHLNNIYTEKNFEGQYMQSIALDGDHNGNKKHGFIYEGKMRREYDKFGKIIKQQIYSLKGPVGTNILNIFTSPSFIHCQEDLWNGIFSSPGTLESINNNIQPAGKRQKINFVAGNPDLIPGLNSIDNYLLIKKIALKGIMDGLKIYKRQSQLDIAPAKEKAIEDMASWFKIANKGRDLDKKILDGLARKRN